MTLPTDLACRLLRFEQQLRAYEKLHADELAELWRTLNECKRLIADSVADDGHVVPPEMDKATNPEDVLSPVR
jgi:hypothetical protein